MIRSAPLATAGLRLFQVALVALFCVAGQAFSCDIPKDLSALQAQVLKNINAERKAAGLSSLKMSTKLERAAQDHACDNADRKSYSHEGSDGSTLKTRLRRVGYGFRTAAENTGRGFGTGTKVVAFWMGSPGHRANILLGKLRDVGIGIAVSDSPDSKLHWVVDFGR